MICNNEFPATTEYFYKNKSSPDGLHPYCKKCSVKKSSSFYFENKEEVNQYKKEWRNDNKEKMRLLKRDWFHNNKEYLYEYRKNNRLDNIERFNQYAKDRQHKNHKITKEQWKNCKDYFNNECAYCGINEIEAKQKQGQNLHKEHVDHFGINDLSNCVPACKICNSRKWKFTLEEWYPKQEFYTEKRYLKILKWINEDYKKYLSTKILKGV